MQTKLNNVANRFKNKHPILNETYHLFFIVIGGVLAALGLEAFLIPNGFLDGGVTGIAIIASKLVDLPVGALIAILNIPFIILAWFTLGKKYAFRSVIGVATLATSAILLHHIEPWTQEYALALFMGGGLLGVGIGIALRNGGVLDGTEALATILANKSSLSVAQLILAINIVIFLVAGFIMGWGYAMSSAICFIVVVVTVISYITGADMQLIAIKTSHIEAVTEKILEVTHRYASVDKRERWEHGKGYVGDSSRVEIVVSRLEASDVRDAITEADPDAVIMTTPISSITGGVYDTLASH